MSAKDEKSEVFSYLKKKSNVNILLETLGQLVQVCVKMLGHKCSFSNSHFIDSGRKKYQNVLMNRRNNKRLPFQKFFI